LSADTAGALGFPTRHAYDFSVLLTDFQSAPEMTGLGHLYLPEGAQGPAPAMVIVHGSGGISPGREHEYAQLFAQNGIAGFVVDYYSPRGATPDTPYVMKTMIASETDVLVDAYAALTFLAGHPGIDPARIGVIGFSYGGMATRYALDDRVAATLSPQGHRFAAHVDFYGPCHQVLGHPGTTGAPYLAVFGDQDNSVDPAACAGVHAAIAAAGSPVEVHILEGVGHAFENLQPREVIPNGYIRGCTFSFDPNTGALLIDGRPTPEAPAGASLDARLQIRAQLGSFVSHCLGVGYLMGRDEAAHEEATSLMMAFLRRRL
jgi:dienelactone hydrolase